MAEDLNTRAAGIVAQATGQEPKPDEKNPHAVELGRLGGIARAQQMSVERRREIAKKARNARKRERYAEGKTGTDN